MAKVEISGQQVGMLMLPTIISTGIISVPALSANFAKQDLWMTPVWGSFFGFMAVVIAYFIHKQLPKKNIIEASEKIMGKYIGKLIGLIYIFFLLHFNGIVLREYSEFAGGTFLDRTSMYIIVGILVLISGYAVNGGLEVIARSAQFFLPYFVIPLIILLLFLIPDMNFKNILPVMEFGAIPSIKGSLILQSWYSEMFLVIFLFPFMNERQSGLKWGTYIVIAIMLILVFIHLAMVFLFRGITSDLPYPVLTAIRYISIGGFFEHVEVILLASWILGTFIKVTVIYYLLALSVSQWLNIQDHTLFIFPLGLLQIVFCYWIAINYQTLESFIATILPIYFLFMLIFLPFLLLIISTIKQKVGGKTSG